MIKFSCSNCGQEINSPETYSGKKGNCPKCKTTVIVPDANAIGSVENGVKQNYAPIHQPSTTGADNKSAQPPIFCISCGFVNINGATFCSNCGGKMGSAINCHSCGSKLEKNVKFCGVCGTPIVEQGVSNSVDSIYKKSNFKRRSPELAALLGFLFGGFGLLYISVKESITALVILLVVGLITAGTGFFILWFGCAIYGYFSAIKWNKQHGFV